MAVARTTTAPPDLPVHDDYEKKAAHARGKDDPFLCLDPVSGNRTACPDEWPAQENLSCDAAGCHGGFEYTPEEPDSERDLLGGAGPSCYTCHGQEWSTDKQ